MGGAPVKGTERALDQFHPWVRGWFEASFESATPPQAGAWPAISSGGHVLIHAPTGSGKTLAAFLWSINQLTPPLPAPPIQSPRPAAARGRARAKPDESSGVRVLYISPLKALNYDIERNLREPLSGVAAEAGRLGVRIPEIRVGVRTGDTPGKERAQLARRPPHILITTPESLYLILGSPTARAVLGSVTTVIVDEIHAVCGTKRGAHLALSLERLERLAPGFQRIGLSATQRPLEEVARFLGGLASSEDSGKPGAHQARPVKIVDAAYRKRMDLAVIGMPEPESAGFPGSVWPQLIPEILSEVRSHRTTLVFCNSRRQAERTADRLNAQVASESTGQSEVGSALAPGGTPIGEGILGSGAASGPFRAHHGSIADTVRRELEAELKAGNLPALIGTSSLELGIDIGSIDLVVQVQSPKSIARGLQRVGRSGHLVGQTSQGKIYATHNEDLLEAAVVGRGMVDGEVEALRIPRNPLDVLAQQVVAAVSVDDWRTADLYEMVKGAYPFAEIPLATFNSVLRMVAGRYPARGYRPLGARIFWDEPNGTLTALPGSRLHAMANAGTIVDRGQFAVFTADATTRVGELDEEFVWESRAGDVFTLGSQVWRAIEIKDDRVIAEPAPGALPRMPFWKGEFPWRPYELSLKLARFRGELARRVDRARSDDDPAVMAWLMADYRLNEPGARQAIAYVRSQLRSIGALSSDTKVIAETYADPLGDVRLVVHSPFGGKVNAGWAIALAATLAERTGVRPDMQVSDDGIMFRVPESDSAFPEDLVESLDAAAVRARLLDHLHDSPLFGAIFRQNATRALLMPASTRGKRTPFWLQRRRAKDLLGVAGAFPDFPIVLETYRECLEDELDLRSIEEVVGGIESGRIKVVRVESKSPSPVARSLAYAFTNVYLYEWDAPRAERAAGALGLDREALGRLFKDPSFVGLLSEDAIAEVVGRAARTAPGSRARSGNELAVILEELGDLSLAEARAASDGDADAWLKELEARSLVVRLPGRPGVEDVWLSTQRKDDLAAIGKGSRPGPRLAALKRMIALRLASGAMTTAGDIAARYSVNSSEVAAALESLEAEQVAVSGYFTSDRALQWSDVDIIGRIRARTLAALRGDVRPVSPLRFAAGVRRRQSLAWPGRDAGQALGALRGIALPIRAWNEIVLPARFGPGWRETASALFRDGQFAWVVRPNETGEPEVVTFPRATGHLYLDAPPSPGQDFPGLTGAATTLLEFLRREGVATSGDLRQALGDRPLTAVRDALTELVRVGAVTADSWDVLGALFDPRTAASESGGDPRLTRDRRSLRSSAARAIRSAATALPVDVRWSTTVRFAVLGSEPTASGRATARIHTLLERYGVLSRYALRLDGGRWSWAQLLGDLALLELRGELRRGLFVAGLPGLQYATSAAVDSLREPTNDHVTVVNAADPGFALERDLFASLAEAPWIVADLTRIPSTWVAFAGDVPVIVAFDNGRRVKAEVDQRSRSAVTAGLAAVRERISALSQRIVVETWNDAPVLGSEGAPLLADAGFRRDYPGMIFDAVQARAAQGLGSGSRPEP